MKVVVIGGGNVAQALSLAIAASEVELVQIFARNADQASEIARSCGCKFTSQPKELALADLYIIAVSDGAIREVSTDLSFGSGVVAHTSGAMGIDELCGNIANRAVLYPLQTFTKGRSVELSEVPFLIETNSEKGADTLRRFGSAMSLTIVKMSGNQRLQLHLAAVLACNFTNHLYVLAEQLLSHQDISFDLLKPLILETAAKAVASPSPRLTQSGPASRNDVKTLNLHQQMLAGDPFLQKLYINISSSIWQTLKKR